MLRVTYKSVRGHLVRFLLTALAVMLGVAFVAGSFVLRDSINGKLDGLLDTATRGLDVQVRGVDGVSNPRAGGGPGMELRIGLPLRWIEPLSKVEGVRSAYPELRGTVLLVGKDGTAVSKGRTPNLGVDWRPDAQTYRLMAGKGPTAAGEVALEKTTMERSGLQIGDRTKAVIGGVVREVTVVGEVDAGPAMLTALTVIDHQSALAAFAPDGHVRAIAMTAKPGVSQAELARRVRPLMPKGVEAVTGKKVAEEAKGAVQTGLAFVTTFLLVFAGITLFVGGFIIVNTFSMLLAQRTRELALLRAVGASRAQVQTMVLGEALIVGVIGSGVGLGLGIGLAWTIIQVVKNGLGVDLAGDLPVDSRTVIVAVSVGTVVTLLSALMPAIRASRVAPVAAMRDDMVVPVGNVRRTGAVGLAMVALGTALATWGVSTEEPDWVKFGVGAGMLVVGAVVASPLAARPVVRVIGWPFVRFGGIVGRLARDNALRVPRRTASTASALMIGLALVAACSVLAQSFKASVADLMTNEMKADLVLSTQVADQVPPAVATKARSVAGVGTVTELSMVPIKIGADFDMASAASGAGLSKAMQVGMKSGSLSRLDRGQILVEEKYAAQRHWRVGTRLQAAIGPLGAQPLVVGGIYKQVSLLMTPFIVGRDIYEQAVPAGQRRVVMVMINAAPGVDKAAVKADLVALAKDQMIVSVQTGKEFTTTVAEQIDQILNLLYGLLALSILIAVLGIVNTLALSVIERTREIGLLRAVGLLRSQLSRMIVIESVATAVFGAVLGTVLGLFIGVAARQGFSGQGLKVLSVPWPTIGWVIIAAGIAGVVAAALPAVRAVRLDVLRAIVTD